MIDDDALLDRLSRALAEPPSEPTPRELLRFRMDVAGRAALEPGRFRRRWGLRTLLAAGLSVGGIGAGATVAGATLPAPLRSAAVSIGLPVDDAPLAAAKAKAARLRDALSRHDVPATATAATALQGGISRLNQSDRTKLGPQANDLLARAANTPTTPPTTPPPAPPGRDDARPVPTTASTSTTVEPRHGNDANRSDGTSGSPTTSQGGDHRGGDGNTTHHDTGRSD